MIIRPPWQNRHYVLWRFESIGFVLLFFTEGFTHAHRTSQLIVFSLGVLEDVAPWPSEGPPGYAEIQRGLRGLSSAKH